MVDSVGDDVFTEIEDVTTTFVESPDSVEVVDPIERNRMRLETPDSVSPTSIPTSEFPIPLDTAVSFRTDAVTLPVVVAVYVRNSEGDVVTQAEHFAYEELPAGEYLLDLAGPIKTYLQVAGPLTVRSDAERTSIELADEQVVRVGARSLHDSPAGTITTTDDPEDVMAALSAFSRALKTTDPERSFPTLRGHPPRVERGDILDIPRGLEAPETAVTVEVPASFEYIYPAASLAYYLGATLEPGPEPRIVTADGFEYALDGPDGFEEAVARTLKQVFVLDCVTRIDGYHDVDLQERTALQATVDVDFGSLYAASESDRLERYLTIDYADVEPCVPTWRLTADVPSSADPVEFIPYFVNDLALVRVRTDAAATDTGPQVEAVEEFLRSPTGGAARGGVNDIEQQFVRPPPSDSMEQAWVGQGIPIGASKAMVSAFENRLDRKPTAGDITITVVCNDTEMADERDIVDEVYGSRENLPFDVRRYEHLTRDELREVLAAETEFLHYIGHIDEEGIECADGKLDVESISSTGVDAFLLNACSSYKVGMDLVEAGAIGGIVTLSDVLNSAAVTMGKTLARLLNVGYPLGVALDTARDESYAGGQYITVGDGGLAIAQPEYNLPDLMEVNAVCDDVVDMTYRTFLTTGFGLGTLMIPTVRDESYYYLAPVEGGLTYELSRDELQEFLDEKTPIRYNGALHWADTFDFDQLF